MIEPTEAEKARLEAAMRDVLAKMASDPEFVAFWQQVDEDEKAIVEFWAQIRDSLDDDHRHETLLWFARSPWWHPAGMLLMGWQGKLHREAYSALRKELDADTPGRRWHNLSMSVGRDSIIRLLGLTGHAAAFYASIAFKAWTDDDDRPWIAGAVGVMPIRGVKEATAWEHLDIREVILWDPRTNEARLAGEHHSSSLIVLPDHPDTSLTVWGDPVEFFKAWAAKRARAGELMLAAAKGKWAHPIHEGQDSNLPGALVIGDIGRLQWPHIGVETIHAGPGMTPAELHFAAVRAANLPRFEGFRGGRGN